MCVIEVHEEAGPEELALAVLLLLNASTAGVRCCSSISRNKIIGVAGDSSAASDISRNTANTRSLTSSAGFIIVGDDSAGGSSSVQSK